METELMSAFLDHVAKLDKAAQRMRAKYVWDTRPESVQENFESDARDWANWKRIGVE